MAGVLLLWAWCRDALANQLQDISFSALPGNRVEIVLTTSEPVANPLVHDRQPGAYRHRSGNTTEQPEPESDPGGDRHGAQRHRDRGGRPYARGDQSARTGPHEIRSEGNKLIVSIGAGRRRQHVGDQPPTAMASRPQSVSVVAACR